MKYEVVMINRFSGMEHRAADLVPEEDLDNYVADAKTRWQEVTVSEEPADDVSR